MPSRKAAHRTAVVPISVVPTVVIATIVVRFIDLIAVSLTALAFACSLAAQTATPDLNALEQRATAEFTSRDCAAAEKTYGEALQMAQAAGEVHRTGLYYLHIGNCRTRAGDFSSSLDAYRHSIAVAEATADNELLEVSVHGAALQLQKMGRIDEALLLGQREYELAQQCGHPDHLARAMWLVGVQDEATGRLRDGLGFMNRALALSRTAQDKPLTGVVLQNLALTYLAMGDVETAAHMEEEILAMPENELVTMATTYSAALTYNNLGEIQLKAGHTAQARTSFQKAIEGSNGPDEWRVRVDALLNLADLQNEAGQFADAEAGFRQALEIANRVKFPDQQSAAWQLRSDILLARGETAGAIDVGAEALRIARQEGSPDRTYKALLSLGAAKAGAGDQTGARENFDEALRIVEMRRAQAPGEVSDLGRAFANFVPLYRASVRNLIDLRLPAEALERAEQAKARVLMDILLRGGVDERSAMTSEEIAAQDKLRKRLAAANAAMAGGAAPVTTRALQDATVEFRQFRRNLYEKHPELAVQSADFEPATREQLGPLLRGPGTALLDYFLVPSGVALFVVRQAAPGDVAKQPRISTYILPDPKHTLAAEARSFRERIAGRDLTYKEAARHLFNRLLAPAMTDLRGTTDWIVSPDGSLWDIPFAALVDSSGHHVIETRTVTLEPSLTAALRIHARQRPAATAGIRLLALGNPLPSPVPLPDAVREVTEIGAHYPRGSALVLTGTSATATAFRDKAPSAGVIHLAAHAGLNDGDPLASFVNLGAGGKASGEDGTLTALDMMSMHLRADMVVLSACETARGGAGPGEGMIGMGWALTAAGASSSVLSMWKVDTVASREFMTSFYGKLAVERGGVSRAEALRGAGLEMLRMPAYRHPFFWAAFTMWGDGTVGLARNGDR